MTEDKKKFIQEYINQLKSVLYYYNKGSSDESSLFDIITEISGVFSKEFPDLQKDLSFNNGSAATDARIVLGLLNKALIEDSFSESTDNTLSQYIDVINQLKLETGSFKSTALTWDKKGNICNYFEQLELALNNNNIKNIKYCLNLINDWYDQTLDRIINASYCAYKNEHKSNASKIKQFLDRISQIPDDFIERNSEDLSVIKISHSPSIFISHTSVDKKYGDALCHFIMGLGIKKEQIVYTSQPLTKIPLGRNIYEYLRDRINNQTFMIYLLSNNYFRSSACLNEMGAAWLAQTDFINVYTPDFDFGNNSYLNCVVDKNRMGIKLQDIDNLRISMIELKDRLNDLFALSIDEKETSSLIEKFIEEIQ